MTDRAVSAPNGLVNLRDLGGLPTETRMVTRSGVVYRSDAPHPGDRDPADMVQWPPAVVVDLRDEADHGIDRHPLAEQSRLHRIPLLKDLRAAPGDGTWPTLRDMYLRILEDAAPRLLEAFRIAVETDGPVLVHCAAGKDRTGVVSALLMRAAGVRADAIVADYARTDRNMGQVLRRLNLDAELPPGVDEEAVRELVSAPVEAIEAVVERLDDEDGGAAGWLRKHGATDDEIKRWNDRFLVEEFE